MDSSAQNRPPLCEACQENPATHCDHNHETGIFRGWLCHKCNAAEGLLGTEKRLAKLLEYVRVRRG